jgi:molybdenum cofactor synthesis domain-containing protein
MCDNQQHRGTDTARGKTVPVAEAVGMVLAHDITEIRKDEFKGRAFRKGHIIRVEDIDHLRKLGKERLFVLSLGPDELHENDAAAALAAALMGEGLLIEGRPREGKINLLAQRDGLLKINREALMALNMLGEVMCATRHGNTMVKKGRIVAGTRAIPLVIKRGVLDKALAIAEQARTSGAPIVEVRELRRPKAGVVITGNEIYQGRVADAFAPVITRKVEEYGGEIVGIYYAPDDPAFIEQRMRELLDAGADLLITTGGMSVDPDDVTRFAIANLGAVDICYGSPVLPGAMFLVAYLNAERGVRSAELKETAILNLKSAIPNPQSEMIPILGIPACGMYHRITVLDLVLPRILAGEKIGRRELAELGYGGLCLHCKTCRYPVCPFGK